MLGISPNFSIAGCPRSSLLTPRTIYTSSWMVVSPLLSSIWTHPNVCSGFSPVANRILPVGWISPYDFLLSVSGITDISAPESIYQGRRSEFVLSFMYQPRLELAIFFWDAIPDDVSCIWLVTPPINTCDPSSSESSSRSRSAIWATLAGDVRHFFAKCPFMLHRSHLWFAAGQFFLPFGWFPPQYPHSTLSPCVPDLYCFAAGLLWLPWLVFFFALLFTTSICALLDSWSSYFVVSFWYRISIALSNVKSEPTS